MSDLDQQQQTSPSFLELEQTDSYGKYLLYSRSEILYVLRAVAQKGCMITAYFDHGKSFLLTSLIQVIPDTGALVFDYGSNDEMNQKILGADRIVFTTSLDRVKVQFSRPRVELIQFQGRPAFRTTLPETVLRLQRREYYRLTTPVVNPLRCKLLVPLETGQTKPMEPSVLDISGGGLGLSFPSGTRELQVGMVLRQCRLNLPEEGELAVDMVVVRNMFDVTTKGGNQYHRVGVEFIDLPGSRLSMIERYITRVERERKARTSGLA